MSKRTIGPDGRDELPDGEQEQQVPVWHSIVGDGWEPVQIGDMTLASDDVLRAGGWVRANDGGGFAQGEDRRPRRRWKAVEVSIQVFSQYGIQVLRAKTGDLLEVQTDGTLKRVDKPQVEGQVER